jgi:phenylpropionate dioxygenase-like ring-hydroxylating dioxygenase large terminal subunit
MVQFAQPNRGEYGGADMVISQKYDIIDTERGLLDRSIFTDGQVYQEELEKIFGRAWLFIGHESLIPNPNDFFLTYMGEDPVILTRDAKGELHAFLNMCRHRGNRIVRADDGNAKNFMCAYHGWTYSNEGKLVSVPGLQEAYYGELDVGNLGLVPVAHLESYTGLVFASWDQDAPTLEAYLGNHRWYMDVQFNRRDGGFELIGPDKWIIPNNWKNSADNFVGDNYHAPISHRSATLARQQIRGPRNGQPAGQQAKPYSMPGQQVSPGNGHGMGHMTFESDDEYWKSSQAQDEEIIDYEKSIHVEMERRLGYIRTHKMRPGHSTLFPNMSWLAGPRPVRIWHPRGPLRTEVWAFWAIDRDASEQVKRAYRINGMQSFGPSGLSEQDDMDNWRGSTEAGTSAIARKYLSHIAMGIGHEWEHPDLPGKAIPKAFGEVNQRSMYVRWQEFMNAASWADIHIDPITAKFEGTATMKG